MKKPLSGAVAILLFHCLRPALMFSQCTTANINWDQLDYLQTNTTGYSSYITPAMYPNMVQRQSFAIGVNRLTIQHNYVTASNIGENTTHTGEAGSRGSGADVEFRGNGVITATFDSPVSNVSFSLYDIDRNQRVAVSAVNGATPVNITMAVVSASTTLSVTGSGGTGPFALANNTTVANNVTSASLNIDIAGPITQFSITVTLTGTCSSSCGGGGTENGAFWLSDLSACVTGGFPSNYYEVARPFTGQPGYVLAVHDLNTVYMVDPVSGRAVSLFTDPDPRAREINNIAYDPYRRIVYYSIDGIERCTPAGSPDSIRYIRKYDFNTETITQVIDNVNSAPFYIPSFNSGLQTGGAAYYRGALYMGVEGRNNTSNSGREAMVWRIDFAADSITPVSACQVWGTPGDNGAGSTVHDWGDFILKDGVLYDFNPRGTSTGNYNIYNLQTQANPTVHSETSLFNKPRQAGQQWNGQLYWLHDSVGTYNGTNGVGTKQRIVAAPRSVPWVLGAGDAGEAFRPKADFGDAPASYDPDPLSPALNERDTALRLGPTYDWEWNLQSSDNANGDGADEDALLYTPIFAKIVGDYVIPVRVWNNTGDPATLCAWFDYNANGLFDPSEGVAPVTVNSSPTLQTIYLSWTGITTPLINGDSTYLRIRLTSQANGMTASNPTGYFNSGETEDYRVLIDDFPLKATLFEFTARPLDDRYVSLSWSCSEDEKLAGYIVERSSDGQRWTEVHSTPSLTTNTAIRNYAWNDPAPLRGTSYYRLKLNGETGKYRYSEIRSVYIRDYIHHVSLAPNPAQNTTTLRLDCAVASSAQISLIDLSGSTRKQFIHPLAAGVNYVSLPGLEIYSPGTYIIRVVTPQKTVTQKLIIGR